jgi:hypothetical protein
MGTNTMLKVTSLNIEHHKLKALRKRAAEETITRDVRVGVSDLIRRAIDLAYFTDREEAVAK